MFTLQMPHTLIKPSNPVFASELQRVRRLRSARSLTRYGRAIMIIPTLLLWTWWLYTVVAFAQASGDQKFAVYYQYTSVIRALAFSLVIAMPVAALVLDLYCMMVTVNSIGHEMTNGQWDLLRLTSLSANDCIAAKYAVAQVRAWRVLTVEIAVRMLMIILFVISLTFVEHYDLNFYGRIQLLVWPAIDDYKAMFQSHPTGTLADLAAIVLSILILLIEPLWRMRSLTALGLAISAQIHNLPFASLAAFGTLVIFHAVEAAIILGVGLLRSRILLPLTSELQLGMFVTVIALIATFHAGVQRTALRYARYRAFRSE